MNKQLHEALSSLKSGNDSQITLIKRTLTSTVTRFQSHYSTVPSNLPPSILTHAVSMFPESRIPPVQFAGCLAHAINTACSSYLETKDPLDAFGRAKTILKYHTDNNAVLGWLANYKLGDDSQINELITYFKPMVGKPVSKFSRTKIDTSGLKTLGAKVFLQTLKDFRDSDLKPVNFAQAATNALHTAMQTYIATNTEVAALEAGHIRNDKAAVYNMVKELCNGDLEQIPDIVESYCPLAIATAGRAHCGDVPKDEVFAQALHALTVAVNAFGTSTTTKEVASRSPEEASRMLPNYIQETVSRSVYDFINSYPLLKIPPATQRRWAKSNKFTIYRQDAAEFNEEMLAMKELLTVHDSTLDSLMLEIGLSDHEILIVMALLEGKTQKDIAVSLNLSRESINIRVRDIRRRAKVILFK